MTYQLLNPDNSVLGQEQTLLFRIAGKNPDDQLCRQYIDQKALEYSPQAEQGGQTPRGGNNALWYVYTIAKSETKDEGGEPYYNQFLANGGGGKNKTKPWKGQEGRPNWNDDDPGKPGGFGIKQITGWHGNGNGNVPRSVIWNWKTNIDEGFVEIIGWHKKAVAWMAQQRAAATSPLPTHTVANAYFQDGTDAIMEDAVAMKNYNAARLRPKPDTYSDPAGTGGFSYTNETPIDGHYCYWRAGISKWSLSRFNNYRGGFNYVSRVCQEVEQ